MSLTLYAHPFSSYCWKALIALYADETAFTYRNVDTDADSEAMGELRTLWPLGKFPLLVDGDEIVGESTSIVEHLHACHRGANDWIPEGRVGRRVRMLDRVLDSYVMTPMGTHVKDAMRPDGQKDPLAIAEAGVLLDKSYDWLESELPDDGWAAEEFSLADASAAPSLFYADWVHPIGDGRPRLTAYRKRLLAHPAVVRVVDEARPYRHYFPPGAPDRD